MSNPAPSPVAEGTVGGPSGPLTPEAIEATLAQFRAWLEELADAPANGDLPAEVEPAMDWATIVGAFTALRHEINLQTKAARQQSDQSAQALALLNDRATRSSGTTDRLIEDLADAADVLHRAWRGVESGLASASPVPAWRRWLRRPDPGPIVAVAEGLELAIQRFERILAGYGLEPITATGAPFDPETMEVLEVVAGTSAEPGTVLEEVRRGYRRDGAVFRCALVKVAGGPPVPSPFFVLPIRPG